MRLPTSIVTCTSRGSHRTNTRLERLPLPCAEYKYPHIWTEWATDPDINFGPPSAYIFLLSESRVGLPTKNGIYSIRTNFLNFSNPPCTLHDLPISSGYV
jgi:hypothetical protein